MTYNVFGGTLNLAMSVCLAQCTVVHHWDNCWAAELCTDDHQSQQLYCVSSNCFTFVLWLSSLWFCFADCYVYVVTTDEVLRFSVLHEETFEHVGARL